MAGKMQFGQRRCVLALHGLKLGNIEPDISNGLQADWNHNWNARRLERGLNLVDDLLWNEWIFVMLRFAGDDHLLVPLRCVHHPQEQCVDFCLPQLDRHLQRGKLKHWDGRTNSKVCFNNPQVDRRLNKPRFIGPTKHLGDER